MLDTRTLIFLKIKCIRHQFHSHQRMTNYNYNKIKKFKNENYLQNINQIADSIIQLFTIVRDEKIKQPRKQHFLIEILLIDPTGRDFHKQQHAMRIAHIAMILKYVDLNIHIS